MGFPDLLSWVGGDIDDNSTEQQTPPEDLEQVSPSFRGGNKKPSTAQKATDKAKDKLKDVGEKAGKKALRQLAKQAALAVGRAIASAAASAAAAVGWPWLVGCLVIFLIIMIIFGGLFASSLSGYFGKTAEAKLNPKTDKKIALQMLASAGDQAAKRELIADEALSAKNNLGKISTQNQEAKNIIDQISQLLDELIALADSNDAAQEKIKQILALLDQLKALLPEAAAVIDGLKTQVANIQKMLELYKVRHLVLNPKDMDYVRNYDIDRRVAKMLVYLVTPEDQGGAGYERIKVSRIKFSYDTERKSGSKETDYSDNEEPNVSAHYTGQAADITEIDSIKCTQIKRRRVGGSKKSKLPAIPVKVAWQTEEGFTKGNGLDAYGQNIHQLFNNLGSGAINEMLVAQLSEILGIELDPAKLKGKSFAEISRIIGMAVLKDILEIPGDYELGNNLGDIVEATGRAYVAKALNVPFEAIQGSTPDEITENVGRAIIEAKMSLPAGSLQGANSGEIFASAGRRFMEESLGLSRGTLSIAYNDNGSLKRAMGQGKIESSLGLKSQTFYGNSVEEIKNRLSKDTFDEIFANPQTIDNWLGLSTGTSQDFYDGRISPNDYMARVGEKVFQKQITIYQKLDKRAEAFGISSADMDAFTRGDKNVFISIGKTVIAKELTVSNEEQSLLLEWFNTKNLPDKLDDDYLAGQFGLKYGDLGKIFVDDAAQAVFSRVGQTEILNTFAKNNKLSSYVEPLQEYRFYQTRLETIRDNLDWIENQAADASVRAKATEAKNLVEQMLEKPTIEEIKKDTRALQQNIRFIQEKSQNDTRTQNRVKEIQKAVNEIIEGKELTDFGNLDPENINTRTDPQSGLKRKDVLDMLRGRKNLNDLVFAIGLRKWEIEFDLPYNSLGSAFSELRRNNFQNADNILLINIGKSRIKEYGQLLHRSNEQIDKDLNLPSGTTADWRAGKLTDQAFWKKVGLSATNNVAANLLNKQFDLNDPNYALTGTDITKTLNGGWFFVALKIGGRAIDEALGLPPGGALDIIQQSDTPGDVLNGLAEQKLGSFAGLNRAVSISGDITYNLGQVKIEQTLGLKHNELNDGNAAEKIRGYTGGNENALSLLDVTLGIKAGETKKLINNQISAHDYIKNVGEAIKNNVFYVQIAKYAPFLKDKDIKEIALNFANRTGSPQDILAAAGANKFGEFLGLDYPVSIRGNFKDNLGQAKIEDRLGLKRESFRDNIDNVIKINGQERFESAFYIERGKLDEARKTTSGYWTAEHQDRTRIVDAILNIPDQTTKQFITGEIDLAAYVAQVGQSSIKEVGADQLIDWLDLDEKYKDAARGVINAISTDPKLASDASRQQLFNAFLQLGGWNLDNMTKFDPGTWNKIFFVDPNDPNHTGLKNTDSIILEQGKKYLPRWLNMEEKYEDWIDIIYEQGLEKWGPAGVYSPEKMTEAIQNVTGIPDKNDAARFVHGDYKGGLTAWGAAQLVDIYNKEFADQISQDPNLKLDYYKVKPGYFNDPTGEKVIGDAAVAAARQEAGGQLLDAETEHSIYQEAIREARDQARKNVQYAAVDIGLHLLDKNIPAGFTAAMREGTSEQKWNMGLQYIGNIVHSANPDIPADILPDLEQYFNPQSPNYHNPAALSNTTYSFLDGKMKDWFGDWVQAGTAKALAQYGQTGHLGQPHETGTLVNIYGDYTINIITNWADKQMGLDAGTTKMVYDLYIKYLEAVKLYKQAEIAEALAKVTKNSVLFEQAQEAKAQAAASKAQIKAQLITFVITTVFEKQFLAVDQKLGLVPGSTAMAVGIAINAWITGAWNPYMIGLFVLTNLFGVYRIDIICTACGNYPNITESTWGLPFFGAGCGGGGLVTPLCDKLHTINADQTCPLGNFDGMSANAFRTHAIAAAQYNVNKLIGDVLNMPTVLKDESMRPTQIMTLRQEDIDVYAAQINSLYGRYSGNMGMWANELMWDRIHIGY